MIIVLWALQEVVYVTCLVGASFGPLRSRYCHYPYFTDEKMEAWRYCVPSLKSRSVVRDLDLRCLVHNTFHLSMLVNFPFSSP